MMSMTDFEIAVTVDDLPRHGETIVPYKRFTIALGLIRALEKYNLPPVTGFVNCGTMEKYPEDEEVIKFWVNSGNLLGNHTYHHPDLRKIEPLEFINEIDKNEVAMSKYFNTANYKIFRYPYLLEGETQEKLTMIRNYLKNNNYTIAHVTIDFLDFLWNTPVCKYISNRDQGHFKRLKELYIETAIQKIQSARDISLRLFGRNIKHILLIHAGIASMLFFSNVLEICHRMGCKFIDLKSALMDEAYQIPLNVISNKGPNFLQQVAQVKNVDLSIYPAVPREEIARIADIKNTEMMEQY